MIGLRSTEKTGTVDFVSSSVTNFSDPDIRFVRNFVGLALIKPKFRPDTSNVRKSGILDRRDRNNGRCGQSRPGRIPEILSLRTQAVHEVGQGVCVHIGGRNDAYHEHEEDLPTYRLFARAEPLSSRLERQNRSRVSGRRPHPSSRRTSRSNPRSLLLLKSRNYSYLTSKIAKLVIL